MSDVITWVNGGFIASDVPAVSALDRGLLLGYGVFETLAVEAGVPFALTRHLRRLETSAQIIGLQLPPIESLRAGIAAVVERWNARRAPKDRGRLRLTVTGGTGALGLPTDSPEPTVIISLAPAGAARKLGSDTGIRAGLSPWYANSNSPIQGAKTLSYAAHAVLQHHARERGLDEVISANASGEICEGATSNVFLEQGGELLTPPLSSGCLPGITRELILEWAPAAGLPVRVAEPGELRIEQLNSADHSAVTGSVRGIMPIIEFENRALKPGPITEAVAAVFARNSTVHVDP